MTHIQPNRAYLNLQLSPVVLPMVGARMHRVFLTYRPGFRRLTPAPRVRPPGPSVTPELEPASQGIWALVSLLMVLSMVAGCVAMVQR